MSADTTKVEQVQSQAQKASAFSTWFTRVFVVAVLVTLPLAYWFGYMGKDWLNRVGIILNFCAGFMLAPELLGKERIGKVEGIIERVLSGIDKVTDQWIANISGTIAAIKNLWFGNGSFQTVNLSILTALFIAVLAAFKLNNYKVAFTFSALMLLIDLVLYGRATMTRLRRGDFNRRTTAQDIFVFLTAPPVGTITVILLIFGYVYLTLYRIINKLLKYVINKLEGDERVKSILIWWGIIFFIVGNLLQFISTF